MHPLKLLENSFRLLNGDGAAYFLQIMSDMVDYVLQLEFYQNLLSFFTPFGILFCIVYFSVELIDKATSVSFTLDSIIVMFMKFIIAFAIVTNVDSIMLGMNDFVNAMNEDITSQLTGLEYLENMWEKASEAGTIAGSLRIGTGMLVGALQILYTFLFGAATQYFIIGVACARAIAIGVKSIIAPIIVPDIFVNGLNSSGIKFLKGLFGDFLQSTVILFSLEICCMLCISFGEVGVSAHGYESALVGNLFDGLAGFICVFILISTIKNSKSYATNILYGFLN